MIFLKKSDKTKKKIVDCTIHLIYKKGYNNTSTKEIANCSGVSEATIFKYFQTKKVLFIESLKISMEDLKNYSANEVLPKLIEENKDKSVEDLLKSLLKERSQFVAQKFPIIKIIIQEMLINEEIKKFFKEHLWSEMIKYTDFIFNKGKETGEFKNIDNNILRKLTFGILIYTVIEKATIFENPDPKEIEKEMDEVSKAILNGIRRL